MQIIGNSQGGIKAPPRDLTREAAGDLLGQPEAGRLTKKQRDDLWRIFTKEEHTSGADAFRLNVIREATAPNGRAIA